MSSMTLLSKLILAALLISCQNETTKSEHQLTKDEEFSKLRATAFDTIKLRIQKLPTLGVSVGLPEKWVLSRKIERGYEIWTSKIPCTDSVKFCASYILNAAPRQKELSVKNYGDFFIIDARKKNSSFTLINRDNDSINGQPRVTMDYIYLDNGLNLGATTTFYFLADKIVILNFVALNEPEGGYVRYRGIYTRTLATLKPLSP